MDAEQAFDRDHESGSLWLLAELSFEWREAQREATLAYTDWCAEGSRTSFTVYRAAQDRADAAQDTLHAHHASAAAPAR